MKNSLWVGLGVIIGVGFGFFVRGTFLKGKKEPFYFRSFAQKGDYALRDTERAISRADF
jgi:hypothetical protein